MERVLNHHPGPFNLCVMGMQAIMELISIILGCHSHCYHNDGDNDEYYMDETMTTITTTMALLECLRALEFLLSILGHLLVQSSSRMIMKAMEGLQQKRREDLYLSFLPGYNENNGYHGGGGYVPYDAGEELRMC